MRSTLINRLRIWTLLVTCGLMFYPAFSADEPRRLSIDDRVAAQRAVEEVYWRHRLWPTENPAPKPPISELMPDAAIRETVEDFVRRSSVLASYAHKTIESRALQAEIERMTRESQAPETLRELFAALYDDPFLIAECLARPIVTQRSLDEAFAGDTSLLEAQLQLAKSLPLDVSVVTPPAQGYAVAAIATTGCTNDAWTPIAPAVQKRQHHTTVWTGAEMIVWGGYDSDPGYLSSGERYNPATNSWTATSMVGNPTARSRHTAVWTGSQMLVWGGAVVGVYLNDGGRYNPSTNTWSSTSTVNAPSVRAFHTAVWTGSKMIVWGGFHDELLDHFLNTGGRYDPSTDSWASTSTGANVPSERAEHSAVWTGSEMIVWGGAGDGVVDTGGRYNPNTNTWQTTSLVNVPLHRTEHSAVWTGSKMIVWGGRDQQFPGGNYLISGGFYDPATNTWTPTSNPPNAGRSNHTAVWTGSEMIAWGGENSGGPVDTGRRYDPAAESWTATSTSFGVPSARTEHTAIWTGLADRRMIVFGGGTNTGAAYCGGECTSGAVTCDDRNLCTTDVCSHGACVSTPKVCTSSNPCSAPSSCDVQTGLCTVGDPIPDGISCNDGNPCTAACPTCGLDICLGGVCGCSHPPGACTAATMTFGSTDIPKAIASSGTPVVTSVITVSGAGVYLRDLDLKTFLRHTNASNLDITLTSPAGTVMTLTTDNGGTNDNVFNGTLWDDQADPGTRGTNLVTDATYADLTVQTQLVPEEALGAFYGENPNGTWTLRISDDETLDGGSLDHWSLNLKSLAAAPPSVTTSVNATGLPLAIPAPLPARDTRVSITASGAGTEIGIVKVRTGITHTNNADLDVSLVSPAGTSVTLTSGNGGTSDNVFGLTDWDDRANLGGQVPYTTNNGLATDHAYVTNVHATPLVPEEAMSAFRGENPNGIWTLIIVDGNAFSGTGNLNSVMLTVTTVGPCPQSCDIDCDDGNACTLDSCDPSSGCAHVNDAQLTEESTGLVWDAGAKSSVRWTTTPNATGYAVYAGNGSTFDELLTPADDSCVVATPIGPSTGLLTDDPGVGALYWYVVRPTTACAEGPAGDATVGPRIPNPFVCDDGNACTTDTCGPFGCLHTALGCDDGIACTVDSCDAWTGCIHAPNGALCDDGNPCTNDACSGATGCTHTNNTAACDDGNACTFGDRCQAGVCSAPGLSSHLVISQIQSAGDGAGGTSDEFVELYNPTSAPVSLTGWSLQSVTFFFPFNADVQVLTGTIPAHGWFLLAPPAYNGPTTRDLSLTLPLGSTAENLELVHSTVEIGSCSTGTIVDRVGYGGSPVCWEGTTTPAPAANNSILRRPGGACGNGVDTNDNAADFVNQVPSTPRNSSSPPAP